MENACNVKWCIATVNNMGDRCMLHKKHGSDLRPREMPISNSVPRTFPPAPWDDERPWYERDKRMES